MPGLCSTGCSKNVFVHVVLPWNDGSVRWPVDIASRSRIRMPFWKSLPAAGVTSGKYFSTGSSMLNLPSACARPTAVDVKLLVSENIWCGVSAANGAHQPSAITWPCRTTMTLFIVSTPASSASMKARRACDDTPCDSGVARGQLVRDRRQRRDPGAGRLGEGGRRGGGQGGHDGDRGGGADTGRKGAGQRPARDEWHRVEAPWKQAVALSVGIV